MKWHERRMRTLSVPMRLLALPLLAALASAAAPPPATVALPPPAKARPISVTTLKTVTRTLSSDAFEGRAPTTPAETKTVAYVIARMKAAGLKPGNAGRWTQDVPLVGLTTSNMTPLTITGGKAGTAPLVLDHKTDMVAASYRVLPHVALENSPLVFVGFGIDAPEKGLERLCGRRREGEDGRHPHQRPGL